jgi:transcription elongation factor GreA
MEGRIKDLDVLLATARVIEEDAVPADLIQVGTTVTIQEEGGPAEVYTIVGAAESDPAHGKVSNESPLGKALMNRKAGETVSVEAPDGAFSVAIVKVE